MLDNNHGIAQGLGAQLQEGREKEDELQRRLEAAHGRSADAEARLESCKAHEASLVEAGRCAAQDLRAQLSRKEHLEVTADGESCSSGLFF
jgi:hypothetical protein